MLDKAQPLPPGADGVDGEGKALQCMRVRGVLWDPTGALEGKGAGAAQGTVHRDRDSRKVRDVWVWDKRRDEHFKHSSC